MACLELIFNISILCGYENGKTNLSKSEQEHWGQHHGRTPSFNLRKSHGESYLKQLREGREEPELSTKLLRVVPERKTRALFSTSTWKMHLTMVESSDRHAHGSCVPNDVPWSSRANRSGCQPSKRVESPRDTEAGNQQTKGKAGEKQHWRQSQDEQCPSLRLSVDGGWETCSAHS